MAVPLYRTFTIGQNGRFVRVDLLAECADDTAAIEAARRLVNGQPAELWDRDRRVAKFDRESE
jgi:hypothetical protein